MDYYAPGITGPDVLQPFGSPVALLDTFGVHRDNPLAGLAIGRYVLGQVTLAQLKCELMALAQQ